MENTNTMQKQLKSELLECAIALENPAYYSYSNNFQNIQENLIVMQDKINSLIKSTKELIVDIDILKEYSFDSTYHIKSECKMTNGLNKYADLTTKLCEKLNDLSEEIKELKEERKTLSKEAERKAKEEVKELKKGAMTGGASGTNNHGTTINGVPVAVKEKQLYNVANSPISKTFPVANAFLQDALHDFKMAKKNKNATILNSRDEIKNKDLNSILVEVGVPKYSKGVYYDVNSKESQTIANSKEIRQFIAKHYHSLLNNHTTSNAGIRFSGINDLRLAIQNCTLVSPRITPDGYFEATVVDYFDFRYIPKNEKDSIVDSNIKDINNWGYSMQERGLLKNYYIVFSIRVKIQ